MDLDFLLNLIAWGVSVLFIVVYVTHLLDIKDARQIARSNDLEGPDYADIIYVGGWIDKAVFLIAVLWLIFG